MTLVRHFIYALGISDLIWLSRTAPTEMPVWHRMFARVYLIYLLLIGPATLIAKQVEKEI